ncbi:MAG TPA: replicative DNA helicase [Thiotrichales bacterium]|nr:replicative DNA helicase [Thiotrichales bacterium]
MAQSTTRPRQRPTNSESLKVPPHALEAEQSVLGGLLLDNAAWDAIADRLSEEDFYRHDHRVIFRAIADLANRDQPVDLVTVTHWLKAHGEFDDASIVPYVAELARNTPSAANIRAYADIVREKSVLRQLISVGTEIADSAFNPEGRDTKTLLDEAEQKVFRIAEQGSRGRQGFRNIKQLLASTVERIDELFEKDEPITGLPTGYTEFDLMTSGLQAGDLIIVAGRPSMGKTSFALNVAQYAALKKGAAVAIFSMEMPGEQLTMRLLSSLGRIDQQRLRSGRLQEEDWPRLSSAVSMLSEVPVFIDDTAGLTPTEIRARARRLKREHDLQLIVIDYLQLMQVSGTSENRATEISEISRSLKSLAKELSCPIIALSQLNRSLENRPNKRPIMSDLRESGAIEQDADLIVFIYRDEVYNEDTAEKGIAEIIIGKQRNGPVGTVKLTFLGQYTSFENYAPEMYTE